jgi:hypothetical protein
MIKRSLMRFERKTRPQLEGMEKPEKVTEESGEELWAVSRNPDFMEAGM